MQYLDQLGEKVYLDHSPERIISLVPSITELLFHLGLEQKIVGVTKFCVHPPAVKRKQIIGGTKKFRFSTIDSLSPDLIIANKEENYKEGVDKLRKDYPVWVSDIGNLEDALSMISSVGALCQRERESNELVEEIKNRFENLEIGLNKSVLYLIWRKPYMTVGGDTFIHSMLSRIGLKNCFGDRRRYPQITVEDIRDLNPDLLLLSSEPYPFKQKHISELRPLLPKIKILLVDGQLFSWYGSRLLESPGYFERLAENV